MTSPQLKTTSTEGAFEKVFNFAIAQKTPAALFELRKLLEENPGGEKKSRINPKIQVVKDAIANFRPAKVTKKVTPMSQPKPDVATPAIKRSNADTRSERNTSLVVQALKFAKALGAKFAVVPLVDKMPIIPAYSRLDSSITESEREDIIAAFHAKHDHDPLHVGATDNIDTVRSIARRAGTGLMWGVSCGATNIVVLDADLKHDGPAKLTALFEDNGGFTDGSVRVPTQSGGLHVYFDNTDSRGNTAGKLKIECGSDVRGRPGQAVMPGTETKKGSYGSTDDLERLIRALAGKSLPALPVFVTDLIGAKSEHESTVDEVNLVKELIQSDWPNATDLLDPTIGLYDLDLVRSRVPEFANMMDAADENDRSTNRWKFAQGFRRVYPKAPMIDFAAILTDQSDDVFGAYDAGNSKPEEGEYGNREISRIFGKNDKLLAPASDGEVFGAVDEDGTDKASTNTTFQERRQAEIDAVKVDKKDAKSSLEAYRLAVRNGVQSTGGQRKAGGIRTALERYQGFTPEDELVQGLWPVRGLCALIGKSNSGKTFFALSAARSLTQGVEFNGGRTIKSGALYLGSEGHGGYDARMSALMKPMDDAEAKQTGLDPDDFATPRNRIELIQDSFDFPHGKQPEDMGAHVYKIASEYRELNGAFPGLLIIDHMLALQPAGTTGFDWQNGVTAELQRLSAAIGCCIVVLIHTSKAGQFYGSITQEARWDRSIELSKEGKGEAAVHIIEGGKMRDGIAGGTFDKFKLVTRVLGKTPTGIPVTSAVLKFGEGDASRNFGSADETVLSGLAACDELDEYLPDHLRRAEVAKGGPLIFMSDELVESMGEALDHYAGPDKRSKVTDPAKLREQRRKQLSRTIVKLGAAGSITVRETQGKGSAIELIRHSTT